MRRITILAFWTAFVLVFIAAARTQTPQATRSAAQPKQPDICAKCQEPGQYERCADCPISCDRCKTSDQCCCKHVNHCTCVDKK